MSQNDQWCHECQIVVVEPIHLPPFVGGWSAAERKFHWRGRNEATRIKLDTLS